MVRGIALYFILILSSFGADLRSNIKSIISEQIYAQNIDKIENIFANQFEFIDNNGNLNYPKITNTLRVNSLFDKLAVKFSQ